MTLSGKQRHYLRALAHSLDPVVQVGHSGLTDSVLAQIEGALQRHELIKVKFGKECPIAVDEAAARLGEAPRVEVPQVIGRIVVLYRQRKKDPKIVLPAPARRPQSKA